MMACEDRMSRKQRRGTVATDSQINPARGRAKWDYSVIYVRKTQRIPLSPSWKNFYTGAYTRPPAHRMSSSYRVHPSDRLNLASSLQGIVPLLECRRYAVDSWRAKERSRSASTMNHQIAKPRSPLTRTRPTFDELVDRLPQSIYQVNRRGQTAVTFVKVARAVTESRQ
jgi:hypothetical protein